MISICLIPWDIYNNVYKIFVLWPWLWILARNILASWILLRNHVTVYSFKIQCPWLPRHLWNVFWHVFQENYKAKVNSNLLLSCLNEAGKSSIFCSLDSLNQFSAQSRHFKKNPTLRKLWSDPPISSDVTVGKLIFYLCHGTDCRWC